MFSLDRERELDRLIGRENERVLRDVEASSSRSTVQDLHERRCLGREKGDVVDCPDGLAGNLLSR